MLKLKLQYFNHLLQRTDSLEKTLMLGKVEGRRRRGQQKMRWLDGITNLMDMSFSNSPSKEDSGRIDWFDLFAIQWILKSLLQHHSSKTINSSALSLLHSPTLTSIHDYWKNHSLD